MYSISEISKLVHVHNQTLRNWERGGLIKPKRFGHVRIFSELDLKRCEAIKRYSRRGVSLQRIQALMNLRAKTQVENPESGGAREA
ncbi:MAG: MerR family transcriptional regulator [Candidatus Firestonebacteria bacterium]|nr:MerR family transcriptional regulator [Candidatus Firestonebacteria bacterium]